MIYFINGQVYKILKDSVIIENNAGIGYEVICNNNTLSKLKENENIRMTTYTHIIQDDIKLFGFSDERELKMFKMLITVNGVGCKMALSMLEVDPNLFINAILSDDAKGLTKIKGVGLKTAQRIIIELKNSVKSLEFENNTSVDDESIQEAKYALLALGYSKKEIDSAMESVDNSKDTESIIKELLVKLNG